MKDTRKYFTKLLIFLLIFVIVQSIWQFARPWKIYVWIAIGVCLLFAIVPILGSPVHALWKAYLGATAQGTRFFQGTAVVLGLITGYRLHFLTLNRDFGRWSEIFSAPPPGDYRWWALAAGIALVIGIIPPLARVIFAGWMKFAVLLQAVVSRVILFVSYLIAVLPVGLLAKIVGKKFLVKGYDPEAESYWIDREKVEFDKRRYQRHF